MAKKKKAVSSFEKSQESIREAQDASRGAVIQKTAAEYKKSKKK